MEQENNEVVNVSETISEQQQPEVQPESVEEKEEVCVDNTCTSCEG